MLYINASQSGYLNLILIHSSGRGHGNNVPWICILMIACDFYAWKSIWLDIKSWVSSYYFIVFWHRVSLWKSVKITGFTFPIHAFFFWHGLSGLFLQKTLYKFFHSFFRPLLSTDHSGSVFLGAQCVFSIHKVFLISGKFSWIQCIGQGSVRKQKPYYLSEQRECKNILSIKLTKLLKG